jgi:hypothetical protein
LILSCPEPFSDAEQEQILKQIEVFPQQLHDDIMYDMEEQHMEGEGSGGEGEAYNERFLAKEEELIENENKILDLQKATESLRAQFKELKKTRQIGKDQEDVQMTNMEQEGEEHLETKVQEDVEMTDEEGDHRKKMILLEKMRAQQEALE